MGRQRFIKRKHIEESNKLFESRANNSKLIKEQNSVCNDPQYTNMSQYEQGVLCNACINNAAYLATTQYAVYCECCPDIDTNPSDEMATGAQGQQNSVCYLCFSSLDIDDPEMYDYFSSQVDPETGVIAAEYAGPAGSPGAGFCMGTLSYQVAPGQSTNTATMGNTNPMGPYAGANCEVIDTNPSDEMATGAQAQMNMAVSVLAQQGPVCCDHSSDYYGHNAQGVLLQGPNSVNVTDTYLMTGMGDTTYCDNSLCSGPNPDDFSGGPDGALPEPPNKGNKLKDKRKKTDTKAKPRKRKKIKENKYGKLQEQAGCGLCGDADGDGIVTSQDASLVLQYTFTNGAVNIPCLDYVDVSGDGSVNEVDGQLILDYVAGNITEFPGCSDSSDETTTGGQASPFIGGNPMKGPQGPLAPNQNKRVPRSKVRRKIKENVIKLKESDLMRIVKKLIIEEKGNRNSQ